MGGDDITGTASNDLFVAATTLRLQSADVLDGGLGTDTLEAKLNSATAHQAVINAIEVLNFEVLGASTMLGSNITGATTVNVTGSDVLTYTNASTGLAFSLSGDAVGLTTNPKGTDSSTQAITIDLKSGALGTIALGNRDVGDATGGDYDQITLNASGATSVTLSEGGSGSGTGIFTSTSETLTVTGSSDLVLNIASAALGAAATGSEVEATLTATSHTGLLTLDVGDLAGSAFLDLSKVTGVDVLRAGIDTNTINGLTSGMTVRVDAVSGSTDDLTLVAEGSSSSDSITVKLQHGTTGSSITFDDLTVTGIENTTVVSTGTNSSSATVGNTVGQIIGTAASKLTLDGDKALTVTQIDNEFTNITITNTLSTDITLEATSAVTVTGGAGNDRIELDTVGDLGTGDSISGGTGVDTLAISAIAGTDFTTTQLGLLSGFEALEYEGNQTIAATSNVTIDLTALGATTLYLNGVLATGGSSGASGAETLTVTALTGATIKLGASVTYGSSGGSGGVSGGSGGDAAAEFTVSVTGAAAAGANDTINLQLVNAPSGDYTFGGFTINNVETLAISLLGDEVNGDVVTITDVNDAQLQTITVASTNTGKNSDGTTKASDSLTITDVESTLLTSFDASSFTGALTITGLANNYIATGANIKGGAGADAITGGVGPDVISAGAGIDDLSGGTGADNIDGGLGNDDIEGDAGEDVLIGGAGDDVITGGADNDTLTLGTGADTVEFDTTSVDTVTDFTFGTGGDVIDLSAAGNGGANATICLQDSDGTLKVLASTTTGAVTIANNQVLAVSVPTYAAFDTATEIKTLFGTLKVFEQVGSAEDHTLLVAAADTGKVYVWDITEAGGDGISTGADVLTLVGILNSVTSGVLDTAVTGNFTA